MKKQLITIAVALLTAGALSTSCSSDFNIFDTTQQPSGNTITFTATLAPKGGASRDQSGTRSGFGEAQPAFGEAKGDNGGTTRAITTGTDANSKEILNVAWASGEQIALYYQTASGYAKATATVQSVDPTTGAATITADLDANTTDGGTIKFVYPSTLVNEIGDDIDELKLMTQYGKINGITNSISKKFDAATGEGKIHLNGGVILPNTATVTNTAGTGNVSLQSRVCICKFHLTVYTIGVNGTLATLTSGINDDLTINDGNGHNYIIKSTKDWPGGVKPSGASGNPGYATGDDIYVAMLPITSKPLTISATRTESSVTTDYTATTAAGTLTAGKFYRNVPVTMCIDPLTITGEITNTLTIPAGTTVTVNNANFNIPNDIPAIKLEDKATLILTGANTVVGKYAPAIQCDGKANIIIDDISTISVVGSAPAIKCDDDADIKVNGASNIEAIQCFGNANITVNGSTITSNGVTPAINCDGNLTIKLNGNNTISATTSGQNAVKISAGKSLDIQGSGSAAITGGMSIPEGATLKIYGETVSRDIYIPSITTLSPNGVTIASTITIPGGNTLRLWKATANITSGPVIKCYGNATIILDGASTITTTSDHHPAIQAGDSGTTLIIQGSGSVTAKGGVSAAGIGGETSRSCGNIIIESGTVNATSKRFGAGIGSSDSGTCGDITINGGTITATGGFFGAGIGSGTGGKCGNIVIGSGVTSITATAGYQAQAPIGKGKDDQGSGSITVDGVTPWSGSATSNLNFAASTISGASDGYDATCWKLTHK